MKSLVIHPKDPSTEFLSPIYANLDDKTVVTEGITKTELRILIEIHDQIIILGHGFQYGLVNPGQFPGAGLFIVDDSMAPILKKNQVAFSSGVMPTTMSEHMVFQGSAVECLSPNLMKQPFLDMKMSTKT